MDAATRQIVRQRADDRCEYCQLVRSVVESSFHIEHIVARQHGGTDELNNLALACDHCNLHKGPNLTGIDPRTGEITALYHPRRDRWDEHFRFRSSCIRGLTPIGRATVRVLQMNSLQRVKLRRLNGL